MKSKRLSTPTGVKCVILKNATKHNVARNRSSIERPCGARRKICMKMNSRNRTFVRQVQVDLLTLDDADLLSTVHQWVEGIGNVEQPEVPEDTRYALGYTSDALETSTDPQARDDTAVALPGTHKQWKAPSPEHLRSQLTAMDVKQFA